MSILCAFVQFFFDFPQTIINLVFGLVGAEPPDLTFGIGSIFGCNL